MKENEFIISLKDDEKVIQEWNESGEVIYRVVKNTLPKTWEEVLAWHAMQLAHGDAWHAYKALSCKLPKGNSRECVELYSTIMLKMVIEALNDGWMPIAEDSNRYYPYICLGKLEIQKSSGANLFRAIPSWLYVENTSKCKHLIKYFPRLLYKYYGELVSENFDK